MRNLLTRVVTGKGTRDILSYITQEELKSKKAYIDTRGTAEEEVLERNPKCSILIKSNMYNNKPVHYIIMVIEELKWFIEEKE